MEVDVSVGVDVGVNVGVPVKVVVSVNVAVLVKVKVKVGVSVEVDTGVTENVPEDVKVTVLVESRMERTANGNVQPTSKPKKINAARVILRRMPMSHGSQFNHTEVSIKIFNKSVNDTFEVDISNPLKTGVISHACASTTRVVDAP